MKKIRFSSRSLFVLVFLVAAAFPIHTVYNGWLRNYLTEKHPEFRVLQQLIGLKNGDKQPSVIEKFDGIRRIDNELAKLFYSQSDLSSEDEVYMLAVNGANGRTIRFRDGALYDHQFTTKELRDSMNSLKLPIPEWYIRFGDWLLYAVFLVVFGCIAGLWKLSKATESAS